MYKLKIGNQISTHTYYSLSEAFDYQYQTELATCMICEILEVKENGVLMPLSV